MSAKQAGKSDPFWAAIQANSALQSGMCTSRLRQPKMRIISFCFA